MSRKHFEIIARNISYISNMEARIIAYACVRDACRETNTRFDDAKFRAACDVKL